MFHTGRHTLSRGLVEGTLFCIVGFFRERLSFIIGSPVGISSHVFIIVFSMRRMVGFDAEGDSLDSDKLRHYLVGGHVADYMRYLSENDDEKYKSHFSRFVKEGVTADSVSTVSVMCDVNVFISLCIVDREYLS